MAAAKWSPPPPLLPACLPRGREDLLSTTEKAQGLDVRVGQLQQFEVERLDVMAKVRPRAVARGAGSGAVARGAGSGLLRAALAAGCCAWRWQRGRCARRWLLAVARGAGSWPLRAVLAAGCCARCWQRLTLKLAVLLSERGQGEED